MQLLCTCLYESLHHLSSFMPDIQWVFHFGKIYSWNQFKHTKPVKLHLTSNMWIFLAVSHGLAVLLSSRFDHILISLATLLEASDTNSVTAFPLVCMTCRSALPQACGSMAGDLQPTWWHKKKITNIIKNQNYYVLFPSMIWTEKWLRKTARSLLH